MIYMTFFQCFGQYSFISVSYKLSFRLIRKVNAMAYLEANKNPYQQWKRNCDINLTASLPELVELQGENSCTVHRTRKWTELLSLDLDLVICAAQNAVNASRHCHTYSCNWRNDGYLIPHNFSLLIINAWNFPVEEYLASPIPGPSQAVDQSWACDRMVGASK